MDLHKLREKLWDLMRADLCTGRRCSEGREISQQEKAKREGPRLGAVPFIIVVCSPTKSRLVVSGATSGRPQALPAPDI
jgi:hypothetical protein